MVVISEVFNIFSSVLLKNHTSDYIILTYEVVFSNNLIQMEHLSILLLFSQDYYHDYSLFFFVSTELKMQKGESFLFSW